ncbi:MAG TPA: hypothetical protein VF756_11965 [Thermoanaerobaculia bacterium]
MRKVLVPALLLVLMWIGAPPAAEEASAQSPTCCVREYLQCVRGCECGVFEFNCRIDTPTCASSCLCNICP